MYLKFNNIKNHSFFAYNSKVFNLNRFSIFKKHYNFFFKSINNLIFYNNNFYRNFSLYNYYIYILQKNYIYINFINNKEKTSIKLLSYQYIYPSWIKLYISGNIIKIKKNMFSSKIVVSNYIDSFYINRYFFLFSKLFIFIFKQELKKLNSKINFLKKKIYFKNEICSDFLNQLKRSKYLLFKQKLFCKFTKNKYNFVWKIIWNKKFKNNSFWIKKYPYNLLKKKYYNFIIKNKVLFI